MQPGQHQQHGDRSNNTAGHRPDGSGNQVGVFDIPIFTEEFLDHNKGMINSLIETLSSFEWKCIFRWLSVRSCLFVEGKCRVKTVFLNKNETVTIVKL